MKNEVRAKMYGQYAEIGWLQECLVAEFVTHSTRLWSRSLLSAGSALDLTFPKEARREGIEQPPPLSTTPPLLPTRTFHRAADCIDGVVFVAVQSEPAAAAASQRSNSEKDK